VAEPTDAEQRWRKRCTYITSLAVLVGLSTILPWFARNTILPAGDGHLEFLSPWTPGRAVAPSGDGWAGPLRTLPWGVFFAVVALAGAVGGTLAKRRAPGDAAARWPVVISVVAAGVGVLMVPLVWIGAATGVGAVTTGEGREAATLIDRQSDRAAARIRLGEAQPGGARCLLVVEALLGAGRDALAFLETALGELLQGRGAHVVATHDRRGALGLRRGMAGDPLLLLDRLRQPLHEALVAADELDLALAAELGAPALLVFAAIEHELLGLRRGGAPRGVELELLGERGVALALGLGEEEAQGSQVVGHGSLSRRSGRRAQAASTACSIARLSSRRAGSFMFCCSSRSIGACSRTARSRSASWPGT